MISRVPRFFSFYRPAVVGGLLLALSACAGAPSTPPPIAETGTIAKAKIQPVDIALHQTNKPLAAVSGAAVSSGSRSLAVTPPVAQKLIGMTASGLRNTLGEPTFRRRDQRVEIWQYGEERCILDLFLYPESGLKNGQFQVTHMEFRGRDVIKVSPAGCFSQLLKSRNLSKAS